MSARPSCPAVSAVRVTIEEAVDLIARTRAGVPPERSLLVAVTGIDGCGKGHVSARIGGALEGKGLRVAVINIDGWLNLPATRFSEASPAEHFYEHAIRFDELFADLAFPLRDRRSVHVEVDHAEETAVRYERRTYDVRDVDVVVLEGIYLLKRRLQSCYDLSFWVECSFDTALDRAIERGQEGLPPEATIGAYRRIYFPAQEIHLDRDRPKAAATACIVNDPRLGGTV